MNIFLNKLERTIGRIAIPNLMRYIIIVYIIGYVIYLANPNAFAYLTLEPYYILHGQIWRLVSWMLIPSRSNIFFEIIMLFFYYSLGTTLERTWGTFKFNLYMWGGVLFTIIGAFILYGALGGGGLISGVFSTYYINLSIFLAFATCYPNMQVLLYFIIPIKMKYMAIVYAAIVTYSFFSTDIIGKVAIASSLCNFLVFFLCSRNYKSISPKEVKRKHDFRKAVSGGGHTKTGHSKAAEPRKRPVISKHKCAVCGRTSEEYPQLTFRFCSKCSGNYEYCQDHLFTHKHVIR